MSEDNSTHPHRTAQPKRDDEDSGRPFGNQSKIFIRRLQAIGFSSYREYLASDRWKAKRIAYYNSGLPCQCLVCRDPDFQLHHRTYSRIGFEQLVDLLPLCRSCHFKVHEYEKTHPTAIQATHKILRMVFGWSKQEARERLKPFNLPNRRGFAWVQRDPETRSPFVRDDFRGDDRDAHGKPMTMRKMKEYRRAGRPIPPQPITGDSSPWRGESSFD